jgi:pimeloyl-ACP methyl ester carboxylesterase
MLAVLSCAALSSGCVKAAQDSGRLVTLPDGRRLNLLCQGAGSPTVLMEGGFAASSSAWFKVTPKLAARFRVCAEDRAGYGASDEGPLPRDGAATAQDLDQALRAAGINGPFILVGHSAGGLYVRLFADRRPRDVVGMVLVDPSVEHQGQRAAAAFGPGAGSLAGLRDRAERCLAAAEHHLLPSSEASLRACESQPPAAFRTQISELDTLWAQTSDEVAAGRQSYGAMPIVVLTADRTYGGVPESARAAVMAWWRGVHREIAARSSRGREELVEGSSHMMMMDRPDAIVAAVESVAAAAP